MSKKVKKRRQKSSKRQQVSPFNIYWNKSNYLLLAAGVVLLLLGYIILGSGDWDGASALYIAPIVLTIAYVVIFPLSIYFKNSSRKTEDVLTTESEEIAPGES